MLSAGGRRTAMRLRPANLHAPQAELCPTIGPWSSSSQVAGGSCSQDPRGCGMHSAAALGGSAGGVGDMWGPGTGLAHY